MAQYFFKKKVPVTHILLRKFEKVALCAPNLKKLDITTTSIENLLDRESQESHAVYMPKLLMEVTKVQKHVDIVRDFIEHSMSDEDGVTPFKVTASKAVVFLTQFLATVDDISTHHDVFVYTNQKSVSTTPIRYALHLTVGEGSIRLELMQIASGTVVYKGARIFW